MKYRLFLVKENNCILRVIELLQLIVKTNKSFLFSTWPI